MADAATSEGR